MLVSGRVGRVPAVGEAVARSSGAALIPVRPLGGFAPSVKEAAQGAALIADGLAGGPHRDVVEAMRLRECRGSVLDHLHVAGAEDVRRQFGLAMRILIAGLTTRALAESAVRAGATIVTVDYFGDLDQARLCETHSLRERGLGYSAAAIVEVARELAYDAVVYCGGLENHPGVVAELARDRTLLGNRAGHATPRPRSRASSSASWRAAASRCPIPAARAIPCPSPAEWLLKPMRGGGGQGVRPWAGQPPAASQIVQEQVDGVSGSAAFVADGRRSVVLGWTEQLRAPGSFRYAGNIMPLEGSAAAREEVDAIADALTREYGLRGLNGFDFVLRADRPVVLEVNPRYCASMELIERASGASVFGLHLAACRGELPARRPEALRRLGQGDRLRVAEPWRLPTRRRGSIRASGTCPILARSSAPGTPSARCSPPRPTRAAARRRCGRRRPRIEAACAPVDRPVAADGPEDDA